MKMTPLDIRQKRFETSFRGYAPREVEAFLEMTATLFEDVARENIALKGELEMTLSRLNQHLEREKALQETMISAQKISEEVKAQAKKEAEIIVAEAELQGEKIVAGAQNRIVELVRDISELRRQRAQFEAQVESVIESHRKLLDTFKGPLTEVPFLVQRATD
jgi:cell division initiation protein